MRKRAAVTDRVGAGLLKTRYLYVCAVRHYRFVDAALESEEGIDLAGRQVQ